MARITERVMPRSLIDFRNAGPVCVARMPPLVSEPIERSVRIAFIDGSSKWVFMYSSSSSGVSGSR